tara:strand:- start:3677 stop:4084 length:408 start_codon:yes stop_codon:yes gene_type:complete
MSEELPGKDDLKKLFAVILGTEVQVKDNINQAEEKIFGVMINSLISSDKMEHKLNEDGGIDAHKLTDPLWLVVENLMVLLYGSEASRIILWYIYERIGPDGKVIPLEESNGKQSILNNTDDLWSYIKYKSPPSTK